MLKKNLSYGLDNLRSVDESSDSEGESSDFEEYVGVEDEDLLE